MSEQPGQPLPIDPRDLDPLTGAPLCPFTGELVPECKRLALCDCTAFREWDE
jgi:hypothetical protein